MEMKRRIIMKAGRKVLKILSDIILSVLVIAVILTIVSMVQTKKNPGSIASILGYKPLTVLSGSMQPYIKAGDAIIVREAKAPEISTGTVITFRLANGTLVTHRVVGTSGDGESRTFKTKGDANNVEDEGSVSASQLIGKLAVRIPYGGYVGNFIRSPIGFISVIILPLLILIGIEVKSLVADDGDGKKTEEQQQSGKS